MNTSLKKLIIGIVAVVLIVFSVWKLERERAGLEISSLDVGTTPATLYQLPNRTGPIVIVAHGFAGSHQILQAYFCRWLGRDTGCLRLTSRVTAATRSRCRAM